MHGNENLEPSCLQQIPKLELHAHLNGCARLEHLQDLVTNKSELPSPPGSDATPHQFFEFMAAVSKITSTAHNLAIVLRRVLEDFEKDGVVYVELRSSPKRSASMSKCEYVETVLQTMWDYKGKMIVRYLISVDQSKSIEEMRENAELAIQYASSSPLVVGVDLCGNFYHANKEHTIEVLQQCKNAGLKIACHIAEDAVISDQTADLLRVIRPDRLGHATLILPDSADGQFVRENKIPIECCMTSNILCRSVGNYKDHHFKTWRDLGHPVILCTDDSGTFDTTLSREYHIAIKSFGLTLDDLRRMNLEFVDWIFDDSVKEKLHEIFKT
ncbi:hypothetical protein ACHWQZ_G014079 [Mnemiopsis leidyi]